MHSLIIVMIVSQERVSSRLTVTTKEQRESPKKRGVIEHSGIFDVSS
jgi:hypothetical protein